MRLGNKSSKGLSIWVFGVFSAFGVSSTELSVYCDGMKSALDRIKSFVNSPFIQAAPKLSVPSSREMRSSKLSPPQALEVEEEGECETGEQGSVYSSLKGLSNGSSLMIVVVDD